MDADNRKESYAQLFSPSRFVEIFRVSHKVTSVVAFLTNFARVKSEELIYSAGLTSTRGHIIYILISFSLPVEASGHASTHPNTSLNDHKHTLCEQMLLDRKLVVIC